ncbi:MAG: ECF transporter S component [Clostridia bacterium]|jgi:riboflavin transporter FmnP
MKMNVNTLVKIAVLAALAFVFMLLEFSLPVFLPFLKFDISEIPVLLAGFTLGPLAAVLVEFIKNFLHLFVSGSGGVGELANFIMGVAFVVPASIIYRRHKSRLYAIIGLLTGIIMMSVVAAFVNYYVLVPFFAKLFHISLDTLISSGTSINSSILDLKTLIVYGVIPFNLFKGFVVSLLIMLIYKKLSPILHKESFRAKLK